MEKLTIKEALQQGYTLCGFEDQQNQTLMRISLLEEETITNYNGRIVLIEKVKRVTSINANQLMDAVATLYYEDDENPDDTRDIETYLKEAKPMFAEFAGKVNKILAKKDYHFLTNIQLVNKHE